MGLLDNLFDKPQAMGLLAAGANMLANNGRQPYQTVWNSLGDGLLGGMQTVQGMKQQQQEQAWKQKQQTMQEQEMALKQQEMQAKLAERANEVKRMDSFRSSPGALGFGLPASAPQARQLLEQGGGEDLGAINEGLNSIDPSGGVPIQAPRLGVFGDAARMQGLPAATVAQLRAQQAALDVGGYANPKDVTDTLDKSLQYGIGLADKQEARTQAEDLRRDIAGGGSAPYFTPVQTAQGVMSFNARTGRMEPVMVGGAPVVGAGADPSLQGRIAGAKAGASEKAQLEAKRDSNMSGMGNIIEQARTVLKQGPTQSSIGTMVDAAGKLVGGSPKGAKEADQLRVIGGALVAKMPRMEGPQSNYDVQNYKEMAGLIGDSTIPVDRRLAALDKVEELWRKYDKGDNAQKTAPPAAIEMLRKNPSLAPQFKQKYGYLP